ncbi:MAG TPA: class I SAM-dependent methyltransferase [Ktedonobacteraceae bacterium]|nr:class I SAM-dependent methyltransferase [Ktedonobacteraceae bacterium]
MHSHGIKGDTFMRRTGGHFNFLFTGSGSQIYDATMVKLTRNLYRRVINDSAMLLSEGTILDVGTGPGRLAIGIAQHLPELQVFGVDISAGMIQQANQNTAKAHLEERVHFEVGNVAHLPYQDQAFDLIVSTISMHHWDEWEQPLRDLYRVLRPGGHLWIYDFRFIKPQALKKALTSTPFAQVRLEDALVRTGSGPFALYRRFALQKPDHGKP